MKDDDDDVFREIPDGYDVVWIPRPRCSKCRSLHVTTGRSDTPPGMKWLQGERWRRALCKDCGHRFWINRHP